MPLLPYLHRVIARETLTAVEAEDAMNAILAGEATTAQIASFLVAMKMKGETADELVGLARAMRGRANKVETGLPLVVDTCGTGGDGAGTFNISTVTALVVAGAGVPVAKHGNRSVSGHFGSADLMEALGVRIAMSPEEAARAIRDTGIGFLFAPNIHPAMKHAAPARQELKMRTVFNLLGPLTNPAGAQVQIVGAPSPSAARLMASALAELGGRGWVVHGSDGLDEITSTGPTSVWEIGGGELEIAPEDFGVERAAPESLRGDPVATARAVLAGERGPARDIVLMNAAAMLFVAKAAGDYREAVANAARSIDSGSALAKLETLRYS
ncbi:MAG: anthranilate phosphoribosyltransferase [Bryobacteraceae bacterium]|nr:anthranilate phosphoribosyltransferase [Bryobacteraceae bacterium]